MIVVQADRNDLWHWTLEVPGGLPRLEEEASGTVSNLKGLGFIMGGAFREKRHIVGGRSRCQSVEASFVGLSSSFPGTGFFRVLGPVERYGTEGADYAAQQSGFEETLPSTEDDSPGGIAEDQQRVDQAVGVPGDEYSAAVLGNVFSTDHLDASKEGAGQQPEKAGEGLISEARV